MSGALWCCAALLSQLWTADLRAGPWQTVRPDGQMLLGTRWSVDPGERLSGALLIEGVSQPCTVERVGNDVVVLVSFPVTSAPRDAVLEIGDRRIDVTLAAVPAPGSPSAIIVLGPGQPLNATIIERCRARLGSSPPPLAVVLAGGTRLDRVTAGLLPVLVLGRGDDDIAVDSVIPQGRHTTVAQWGALGLPTTETPSLWPQVIARDFSSWTIPVVTGARWDPALFGSPATANVNGVGDLIGLFDGVGIPAALMLGSRCGFVSEPLALAPGGVKVRTGGVRLIGGTPMGDGIAGLDGTIASAFESEGVCIITADRERVHVELISATEVVPLTWERASRPAGAWGGGEVTAGWAGLQQPNPVVAMDIAWALPRSFDVLTPGSGHREALVALAGTDALAKVLARRLLIRSDYLDASNEPEWLMRERVLRDLGARTVHAGSPASRVIPITTDHRLVHAAIRCADGRARGPIFEALIRRLRNQIEGSVPFANDPLDRHRLMSAVFDAPDRSPTALRSLARDLVDRLDPLSRGPIERFLVTYGEYRTPGQP